MNANLPARDTRDVNRLGVQCGARHFSILACLCALALIGCGELPDDLEGHASGVVPPQFTDVAVVSSLPQPTDIAFTPDGRMLIAQQNGRLRVYVNGALRSTPALDLSSRVCTNSERGLLGVTVDPQYSTNHYIYVFYTHKWGTCVDNDVYNSPQNRVSRFVYNPATETASGETVLLDRILSLGANHNGGDLAFGSDGLLYVTSGDSGCDIQRDSRGNLVCGGGNANATFTSNLSGKILRITRDGAVPGDNPFVGAPGSRRCGAGPEMSIPPVFDRNNTQPCTEIFAYGLRNPFRFAFKPGTNIFFINDVGQNRWEEIDQGARGADYGWNSREAHCANGQACGPYEGNVPNLVHAYGRSEGCVSITGGAFVPDGAFGASYNGAYLFADYGCGRISKLSQNSSSGRWEAVPFATQLGGSSATSLQFGPSARGQSLYYTTYAGGGQVRRIDFTGSNNTPPNAAFVASPTSGPTPPLPVSFDASASNDTDAGDRITEYEWRFGDGSDTRITTTPTTRYTYSTAGVFTATLRVKDSRGVFSQPVSREIRTNNAAPVVTINEPAEGATFIVGQNFRLRATATDREDGTLADSRIRWEVLRRHDQHTHPYFPETVGNNLNVVGAAPEDLLAASNSHLEVRVTVTDSGGLETQLRRDIFPNEVALSFATDPPGLKLELNGDPHNLVATPVTVTSWQGWNLGALALTQTDASGATWTFSHWSDGVTTAQRSINTSGSPASYKAFFTRGGFTARVNFQPAGSPVPADYVADTGLSFGARGNGLSYGWNAATNETRDRGVHANQLYDTLNHLQKPSNPNARWEIAVPNGTYAVRAVAGDPSHFDSVFNLQAEGQPLLSGTPTSASRFVEGTATVAVSDGRLTITSGPGSSNNKLNFVEITQR